MLLEVEDLGLQQAEVVNTDNDRVPERLKFSIRQTRSFTITQSSRHQGQGDTESKVEERRYRVHPVSVRLQRFDVAGKLLNVSKATLYEEPLVAGFWPFTQDDKSKRDWDMAFALTMTLQELAIKDPVLQDLLFRVVDRPSIWSMITHFGIHVQLTWDNVRQGDVVMSRDFLPELGSEVRTAKFDLKVNGSTAALLTLLVAKPGGASFVCGGLVGAIVEHPQDPSRRAVARLLGTRRGK